MTINEYIHYHVGRSGLPEQIKINLHKKISEGVENDDRIDFAVDAQMSLLPDDQVGKVSGWLADYIRMEQQSRVAWTIDGETRYFNSEERQTYELERDKDEVVRLKKAERILSTVIRVPTPESLLTCTRTTLNALLISMQANIAIVYTHFVKDKPVSLTRNLAVKKLDEMAKYVEVVAAAAKAKDERVREREKKKMEAQANIDIDKFIAANNKIAEFQAKRRQAEYIQLQEFKSDAEKSEYLKAEQRWLDAKFRAMNPHEQASYLAASQKAALLHQYEQELIKKYTIPHSQIVEFYKSTIDPAKVAPLLDKKLAAIKRMADEQVTGGITWLGSSSSVGVDFHPNSNIISEEQRNKLIADKIDKLRTLHASIYAKYQRLDRELIRIADKISELKEQL